LLLDVVVLYLTLNLTSRKMMTYLLKLKELNS